MSQTPDPTDAKADGNFGSAGSHRTGYANDKLANAEYWARKGGTLNAGEGAILCEEIDRLRSILSALREPSEAVISQVWGEIIVQCMLQTHDPKSGKPLKDWICHEVTEKEVPLFIRAAVAAAEKEASDDE